MQPKQFVPEAVSKLISAEIIFFFTHQLQMPKTIKQRYELLPKVQMQIKEHSDMQTSL